MTVLLAQDLDVDNFLNLVRETPWPKMSLIMAFSPVRACFGPFHFEGDFLRNSDQGRIFFPQGEFKWRRVACLVRCVYLGEDITGMAMANCTEELSGLQSEPRELILWGIRTDLEDEWIEQQVPHHLKYPIITKTHPRGRVALIVEDWLDAHGIPQFSRYHSLKEIPGGAYAAR